MSLLNMFSRAEKLPFVLYLGSKVIFYLFITEKKNLISLVHCSSCFQKFSTVLFYESTKICFTWDKGTVSLNASWGLSTPAPNSFRTLTGFLMANLQEGWFSKGCPVRGVRRPVEFISEVTFTCDLHYMFGKIVSLPVIPYRVCQC